MKKTKQIFSVAVGVPVGDGKLAAWIASEEWIIYTEEPGNGLWDIPMTPELLARVRAYEKERKQAALRRANRQVEIC